MSKMEGSDSRKKKKGMHPYVPHLLDDIRAAHRVEDPSDQYNEPQTLEEELKEMERWVAGEFDNPPHTFSYYCGLKPEDFPPPEQLNDRDIKMICDAFKKLLFSWKASIDLPEAMPDRIKYTFMVNCLNEGFTPVNSGFIGFDYCTGYAPDCPFGEYCPCLEVWKTDTDDLGQEKKNEDDD
jgi:hypothetical protein